jgi:hypothetical protein
MKETLVHVHCIEHPFLLFISGVCQWCVSPRVSSVARPVEFQGTNPQYVSMDMRRELEVGLCFLVTKLSVPSVFPCFKCEFVNVRCVSIHPVTADYIDIGYSEFNH